MSVARPGALTPLELPPLAEKPLVSVPLSNYMACDDGSTDDSRGVIELALNRFWTDSGWKRIASILAQIGKVNPRFDIRHQQEDASL